MKRLICLLLALCCLLPAYCFAQDSISTTSVSTVRYRGRTSVPTASTTGNAVCYFDKTAGKLKCSQNGGAFADASSSGLTVGTTTITSGTTTRILYDNAGVLGEYVVSGTGNVAMTTSPTFVTPTLGAALVTSINGNIFTTGTYTLTGTAGKTLTFSNTLTLAGTDSSTLNIGAGGTLGSAAFTAASAYLPIGGGTLTGDLLFTDNLYDIGKSGATRPRDIFASRAITAATSITAGTSMALGSTGSFFFGARAGIYSPADGIFRLANQADDGGFLRLQFGLTTNSYPSIGHDAVNGFTLQSAAGTATWNDPSTANSGTVANRYLFGIAAPTLMATGTSVTDTVASTVYIGGAPTASTNTTIGTAWALLVAAGGSKLNGTVFVPNITASAGLQTAVLCQSSGGEMIADSVACLASSARFKENVKPLVVGLDEVMKLRPVSYHYKPEGIFSKNLNFQRERVGFLAEDVARVDSRFVGYEADNVTPRTVGYDAMVPLLVKAIQELHAEVEGLKGDLRALGQKR